MKIKKSLFLITGLFCLGIGCIGIVLPFLPTVPFFLATVYCFAKSSQRLHGWFIKTKMYKKHLEAFVNKKGMSAQTKAMIILSVTFIMGFGFFMMGKVPIARIVLGIVWLCHIAYFVFGVKTIGKASEPAKLQTEENEKCRL
jgi:hypothetical protein